MIKEFQDGRFENYRDHSHQELEHQLGTTDRLRLKLIAIRDKYVESIAADDKGRETHRAETMAISLTKMPKK